jgi:hypothetical protein
MTLLEFFRSLFSRWPVLKSSYHTDSSASRVAFARMRNPDRRKPVLQGEKDKLALYN